MVLGVVAALGACTETGDPAAVVTTVVPPPVEAKRAPIVVRELTPAESWADAVLACTEAQLAATSGRDPLSDAYVGAMLEGARCVQRAGQP